MPKQEGRAILWALVAGVVIATLLATKLVVEKRKLASAYQEATATLTQLQEEQARLNEELTQARETMEGQSTELASLQNELSILQTKLGQTEQELAQLRQANEHLTDQVATTTQEKEALEAKLSNLKELKLAIRDVRRKLWHQRWETWLARMREQQVDDQRRLAEGNRGYVVHNSKSTLGAAGSSSTTTLQVRVLEPQTE